MMFYSLFNFVKSHWGAIVSILAGTGAVVTFTLSIEKLLRDRSERKRDAETKDLAQTICLHAELVKKQKGTVNILFSDEEIRGWHSGTSREFRVQAALAFLLKEGRARKAAIPGYWEIN